MSVSSLSGTAAPATDAPYADAPVLSKGYWKDDPSDDAIFKGFALGSYDDFGGTIEIKTGFDLPRDHSDGTTSRGFQLDFDLELRAPYGFGMKTELGQNHAQRSGAIADPDFVAANRTVDDSNFVLRRDESYYLFPTSVRWHTPSFLIGPRVNDHVLDEGVSFDVGTGLAAQHLFSGSEIDETWTETYTSTSTGTCHDRDGRAFDCSHTTTRSYDESRKVSGGREDSWAAVPFVDAGITLGFGMDSSAAGEMAHLRLGYTRYLDPNASTDPGYVTLSYGATGFFEGN